LDELAFICRFLSFGGAMPIKHDRAFMRPAALRGDGIAGHCIARQLFVRS